MAQVVEETRPTTVQPTIGRIVILHNKIGDKTRERAAIICKVNDDGTVNLRAFNEDASGGESHRKVLHMSKAADVFEGWSWPARV